jgi:phosphoglycerate dehydrogenase-like enzyme
MLEVLRERSDLTAVLDVCDPEPAPADWPLLALPNVIVTSHIAGSHGPECRRLGRYMVEEFRRYLRGEPLRWQITHELTAKLA